MTAFRTIGLFILAGLAEIGGAWLVWQGVREGRGVRFVAGGFVGSPSTGWSRRVNPTQTSGGCSLPTAGVFIAGSLAWGMVVDSFRPDRFDIIGAAVALVGAAIIVLAPRVITPPDA